MGLRENIADPIVKIVLVAHGPGIDFLLEDVTNQLDQPFAKADNPAP